MSEIVLYRTQDGGARVEVRFEDGMVWLTPAAIAELFQTTPQNITMHLGAIYEERELSEERTCKDYLQVRREGARDVRRSLKHYNLEAILAVGYRVRCAYRSRLTLLSWCRRSLRRGGTLSTRRRRVSE